jgi:serine/threonine protein kinase
MLDETTYNQSVSAARRQVENATRKITDYNLTRIIGTGTFGKVFLAMLGDKAFAVKVLHKRKIIELK